MIRLNLLSNSDTVIVTLTELTTISDANFLFVFEREMPGERVAFVLTPEDDLSTDKKRYNEYSINTGELFSLPGRYVYRVYEQAGALTDETGLNLIEQGICEVVGTNSTSYTQYAAQTEYSTYNA